MIPYASRTGTKRNLDALRRARWRLLVSARGVLRTEGFPYALDNGAWTSYQRGERFDADAFYRALGLLGRGADWIVVPDVVGGGPRSLDYSLLWLDEVRRLSMPLIAVQDGMDPAMLEPHIGPAVGLAVGGTDDFKLSTMGAWGDLAARRGAYLHVLRVNSQKRIRACLAARAMSFDGSGPSRFAKHLDVLQRELDRRPDYARRRLEAEAHQVRYQLHHAPPK